MAKMFHVEINHLTVLFKIKVSHEVLEKTKIERAVAGSSCVFHVLSIFYSFIALVSRMVSDYSEPDK